MHTREITLRYGCSPVNLLYIFRTPFPKNSSGWLLPDIGLCHSSVQFLKVGNIRKSYGLSFNSWDYSLLSEHEISSYWLSLLIIHQWPVFINRRNFLCCWICWGVGRLSFEICLVFYLVFVVFDSIFYAGIVSSFHLLFLFCLYI